MKFIKIFVMTFLFSSSAFAWTPTKDITMIVPFPPGSGNDLIARSLSEAVTRNTGVKIIIDNKPGAGGTVGMAHVTRLSNDGHYASLASFGGIAGIDHALPTPPTYDIQDFSYAIKVGYSPVVIVAHKDDPINTAKELANVLIKEEVTVGHSGGGGRLGLESVLLAIGANKNKGLERIEHRGPAQTAIDVAGKHVRFGALPLSVAITFKDADKIKILTHTAKNEIKTLPQARPFSTVVSGFNATVDWGVALPKEASTEVLNWYAREYSKALSDEKVMAFFATNFMFPSDTSLRTPQSVTKWVKEQRKKNTPVIQEVIKVTKQRENK